MAKKTTELDKLKALAAGVGIDAGLIVNEIAGAIKESIEVPDIDSVKEELVGKLDTAIKAIQENQAKIANDVGEAFKALPAQIQSQVETQFRANTDSLVEQLVTQFKEKGTSIANSGDNSGAGSAIGRILNQASIADILKAIELWKAPSSDQQLAGVMKTFLQGMNFGSKLKSGTMSPDEVEKALGFATK